MAAAGSAAATLRERPAAEFVINVDPRESDLRHVAPTKVEHELGAAAPTKARPGLRRVELWHAVAAALLLLLLGEALLVRRA